MDEAFFNAGIRIYPGTELETVARTQGVLSRSSEELLAPLFYVSPEVDTDGLDQELNKSMKSQMNFITMASMGHSFLPTIHRISHKLGLKPPLWRHTGIIRRGLRLARMDV